MIALDTNVLVRFLVEDDEKQSRRATSLIENTVSRGDELFISDFVMCETVWVLASAYRFTRSEVAEVLARLMRARSVVFTSSDRLVRALQAYRDGTGDFADYLIREIARGAGADTVATFDRKLLKEHGFLKP